MTRRIPPVRRLLMDAKALISKPECWTKGAYSRSVNNRVTSQYSSRSRKFCMEGAVFRMAGLSMSTSNKAQALIRQSLGDDDLRIHDFNDAPSTTHPMIMRLFNEAIRRAKEQGI